MAKRPVFLSDPTAPGLVRTEMVDFTWHPGLAFAQKQRNVAALHAAAMVQLGLAVPLLEVSTKSTEPLGASLSAFNLTIPDEEGREIPVECWFQSAKRFRNGGPFTDLRNASPRDARGDPRLKQSGDLDAFVLDEEVWPLAPSPSFYDWLYLRALNRRPELLRQIAAFSAFTDIEFNPSVSVNCQARTVALAVALGDTLAAIDSPIVFRERFASEWPSARQTQLSLF